MPGTNQLQLYNKALRHLGERKLASLSEAREPRRVLDDEYDDALNYCLGQGYWNFAMRSIQLDASTSVTPTFGYQYAFAKPSDWLRTFAVSTDPTFNPPLLQYNDEVQYWYADSTPLYFQFISNSPSYGLDLTQWPDTFIEYVAAYLARKVCPTVTTSDAKLELMFKIEKGLRIDARAKDAMNEPPKYPPRGTWVRSRNYGNSNNSNRGLGDGFG